MAAAFGSLHIPALQRIFDRQGNTIGLAAIDFSLDEFSDYLATLDYYDESSLVLFIVERDGDLMGASDGAEVYKFYTDVSMKGTGSQVPAVNSSHHLIASAAAFFESFNFVDREVYLHEHRFVQATVQGLLGNASLDLNRVSGAGLFGRVQRRQRHSELHNVSVAHH